MNPSLTNFNEHQIIRLLALRAVEEHQPELVPSDLSARAALAALPSEIDAEWLQRRAAYLFNHLPNSLKVLDRISLLPHTWTLALLTLLIGAASNYLGPSGQVHVVYNPIVVLLLWNLGIYLVLLWPSSRSKARRRSRPPDAPVLVEKPLIAAPSRRGSLAVGPLRWFLYSLLRDWFCWWHSWRTRIRDTQDTWRSIYFFFNSYADIAGPLIVMRMQFSLHLAAIGMAAGAIIGVYLRGLFLDYHAIWQSTFLHDPEGIVLVLNSIVGLASVVLDGKFLTAADVYPLLDSGGAPAALWIHRLALTVFIAVVLPRLVLAFLYRRRAAKLANHLYVDLSDPYYLKILATARQGTIHRRRDEVAMLVRTESEKLADATALFVREKLFDKRIVPLLITFRMNGGRVRDLETQIANQGARFEFDLREYLDASEAAFTKALMVAINKIVGRELATVPQGAKLTLHPSAKEAGDQLAGSVAGNLSDFIGAAATAAVAAAVGTISGGIGKTLGMAIISTLLGTSGPIGLLIGGISAMVVAGGAYLWGREQFTATAKQWSLPPVLAKIALRDSKIEDARVAVYSKVKNQVEEQLELHAAAINREVLRVVSTAAAEKL